MNKTKEQKVKEKADKKAAKQAAKETKAAEKPTETSTIATKTKAVPEKSAAQKKLDAKKAKAVYLKESLTSVQQNKLVTLSAMIIELRTDPKKTVADLQAAIPEWQKKLDELKI